MKDVSIGGYLELELQKGKHFHPNAIRLNTARNCFEYILLAKNYKKVFIPYYTCDVILEPLHKHGIKYELYHINVLLDPAEEIFLKKNEAFLYTNYFGIKQKTVKYLAEKYGNQLIIDNAQSFFSEPIHQIDTFYSPRKFVGVADGGYLYTDKFLNDDIEKDTSFYRMSHLLKRIDVNAEDGFHEFQQNDGSLKNNSIRKMSNLTERMLESVDYNSIVKKRKENFNLLHSVLHKKNDLFIEDDSDFTPMVYPFYVENENLRETFISNKIYTATYWPNVLQWTNINHLENRLAKYIIPLPIDQRYGIKEMNYILEIIHSNHLNY